MLGVIVKLLNQGLDRLRLIALRNIVGNNSKSHPDILCDKVQTKKRSHDLRKNHDCVLFRNRFFLILSHRSGLIAVSLHSRNP